MTECVVVSTELMLCFAVFVNNMRFCGISVLCRCVDFVKGLDFYDTLVAEFARCERGFDELHAWHFQRGGASLLFYLIPFVRGHLPLSTLLAQA